MYQALIHTGKKRTNHKNKNRVFMEPDEDQEYGIVRDLLGSGRVKILCSDSKERIGRIRGSMRFSKNKVLIEKGNIVIISKRDGYDEDKVDIIHKYSHEESNILHVSKSLPNCIACVWTQSDSGAGAGDNDEYIEFKEEDLTTL